jgi:hypothetical protein
MSNLHKALIAAHEALLEAGDEDNAYEIESAIGMFAPHQGDDPEAAKARKVQDCHCGNCDFSWPAMAMPALVTDVALTGQRLAKCPRCFATENIFISK